MEFIERYPDDFLPALAAVNCFAAVRGESLRIARRICTSLTPIASGCAMPGGSETSLSSLCRAHFMNSPNLNTRCRETIL